MALSILFLTFLFLFSFNFYARAIDVSYDGRAIKIDGKRRILLSGAIHYPRSTTEMWPDLIKKAKEGGLDAIETYVFWNAHEPSRRKYNFDGNLDLIRFLKTIEEQGLYAVLRIGPYVCAEWNYGGFPVWLHNMPGIQMRTANEVFMNEMQNFTTLIVDMAKKEKLFAHQGGPIILAQIENEYGNIQQPYGAAGKAYIDWCANMAVSLNIGVPWIMCQQPDAPQSVISTCNGFYCDGYKPKNPNTPKMWTENWTGWYKNWGGKDPYRTAEDLAFAVARFFQRGGTFQNYYMYHGGTNFGRTAGGPYITTSYDYDAPIDEYGNLNQPKWGHLKQLHQVLKSIENTLTHGNINSTQFGNSVYVSEYATNESSSCFFGNANATADANITYNGKQYTVPAWSVSILPDCKNEVYNTAKVNTQTSVKIKKENKAEDQPESLKWLWRPESVDETLVKGKGDISANKIIDQKVIDDASDYLWYMSSLNLKKDDHVWSKNMTLRITGTGHVFHVYVNGEYIASKFRPTKSNDLVLEESVKFKPGKNLITILSVTVGFSNYGAKYDTLPSGIDGQVAVIGRNGDETIIKELAEHKWTYKVGLNGLENKFFNPSSEGKWSAQELPTDRRMTWYKTTFKAPLGKDPVVVDLQGLGKGEAWVNGQSIGRYWPSYITGDGCSAEPCDYRGKYESNKCLRNCGQPTQRWYHIPRSFLKDDENTLILFEEIGGNPSLVKFQTVTIGTVCGNAYEKSKLEISCQNRPISAIKFASFGNPKGKCGSFEKGACEGSNNTLSILQKECLGKESCTIDVSENKFGPTSCGDIVKRLAVEAVC